MNPAELDLLVHVVHARGAGDGVRFYRVRADGQVGGPMGTLPTSAREPHPISKLVLLQASAQMQPNGTMAIAFLVHARSLMFLPEPLLELVNPGMAVATEAARLAPLPEPDLRGDPKDGDRWSLYVRRPGEPEVLRAGAKRVVEFGWHVQAGRPTKTVVCLENARVDFQARIVDIRVADVAAGEPVRGVIH